MKLTNYGRWTLLWMTFMLIISLFFFEGLWFFAGALLGHVIAKLVFHPDDTYLEPKAPMFRLEDS